MPAGTSRKYWSQRCCPRHVIYLVDVVTTYFSRMEHHVTARVCTKWFQEHSVQLLTWPGNSPDLNTIVQFKVLIELCLKYIYISTLCADQSIHRISQTCSQRSETATERPRGYLQHVARESGSAYYCGRHHHVDQHACR